MKPGYLVAEWAIPGRARLTRVTGPLGNSSQCGDDGMGSHRPRLRLEDLAAELARRAEVERQAREDALAEKIRTTYLAQKCTCTSAAVTYPSSSPGMAGGVSVRAAPSQQHGLACSPRPRDHHRSNHGRANNTDEHRLLSLSRLRCPHGRRSLRNASTRRQCATCSEGSSTRANHCSLAPASSSRARARRLHLPHLRRGRAT
jgi:hypothetical protein